jgi:hypothetical protein
VVLGQTLQTSCGYKALRKEETDCHGELVALLGWPAADVLQESGKTLLLEGFLKIFEPEILISLYIKQDRSCTHLRFSLLKTSTYFFNSSISGGLRALKTEKGDMGAPSSR